MDNFLLPLCQINTNKKIVFYFCLLRIYAVMNEWLQLQLLQIFGKNVFPQNWASQIKLGDAFPAQFL